MKIKYCYKINFRKKIFRAISHSTSCNMFHWMTIPTVVLTLLLPFTFTVQIYTNTSKWYTRCGMAISNFTVYLRQENFLLFQRISRPNVEAESRELSNSWAAAEKWLESPVGKCSRNSRLKSGAGGGGCETLCCAEEIGAAEVDVGGGCCCCCGGGGGPGFPPPAPTGLPP
jgi:L-rhamnose mutarotase